MVPSFQTAAIFQLSPPFQLVSRWQGHHFDKLEFSVVRWWLSCWHHKVTGIISQGKWKVHGTSDFFHPGVVWWCFSSYCIFWSVPLILCMQWKDEWCISKRWQLVLSYWWNDVPETYTDSKSFLPLAVGLVNFLRLTCFSPVVPAEDCFGNKTYKPGQTRWLVEEIVLAAPMPIAKDGPRKPWKRGLRFACYIVC